MPHHGQPNISALWPTCTATQRSTHPSGEHFDLNNISGNESDDDQQSTQQPTQQPAVQGAANIVNTVNIPALPDARNAAADTRYFFEKLLDKYVCRECR